MNNFIWLIDTLTKNIKTFNYFTDWEKSLNNLKKIEKQLNLLNFLIWKKETFKNDFIGLITDYPEVIKVFPILLAVRDKNITVLDNNGFNLDYTFEPFILNNELKEKYYRFIKETGLEELFINEKIKNLVDYVFGVEVWLDSNARKNRSGSLMENIVEGFLKDFCKKNSWFEYKEQATVNFMKSEWGIEVQSDKSSRRFDFAMFDSKKNKVFLIEVNYYWWGWSKLKAVAWEFAWLYDFMQKQNISFFWITDWLGWNTAKKPLEEAYNKMNWNIYNIEMLKDDILSELIK